MTAQVKMAERSALENMVEAFKARGGEIKRPVKQASTGGATRAPRLSFPDADADPEVRRKWEMYANALPKQVQDRLVEHDIDPREAYSYYRKHGRDALLRMYGG